MDRRYAKYLSLGQSHGLVCEHFGGKGSTLDLKTTIAMIQTASLAFFDHRIHVVSNDYVFFCLWHTIDTKKNMLSLEKGLLCKNLKCT